MMKSNKTRVILPGDKPLWVVFFFLVFISLMSVYTSVGLTAVDVLHKAPVREFMKHCIFVFATLVGTIFCSRFNLLRRPKLTVWAAYALTLVLLCMVLTTEEKRWLSFTVGGPTFQPSELAKITMVLCVAYVATKGKKLSKTNPKARIITFFVSDILILIPVLLVWPGNLSMALLLGVIGLMVLCYSRLNDKAWFIQFLIIMVGAVALFLFIYYVGDKIQVGRFQTWNSRLHHYVGPTNYNELTQDNIARMAVARGGFWGAGIGNTIHARLMTQAQNDFIFSIIIEESGMIAAIVIFVLYMLFFFRCMLIATRSTNSFNGLCVAGLATAFFGQAVMNMCVAVGAGPVTGQTLPFISYGGTAYIVYGLGFLIIQMVAHKDNEQYRKAKLAEEQLQLQQVQECEQSNETVEQ
ncbi:MAG: FtsW/RodA/SpoVE family cell cycle protein [Bacteroidales bacterium]|nr:FtsW/RodA/SpoVE family cell cycle protein [Bacteroidales bacterium]